MEEEAKAQILWNGFALLYPHMVMTHSFHWFKRNLTGFGGPSAWYGLLISLFYPIFSNLYIYIYIYIYLFVLCVIDIIGLESNKFPPHQLFFTIRQVVNEFIYFVKGGCTLDGDFVVLDTPISEELCFILDFDVSGLYSLRLLASTSSFMAS